MCEVWRKIAVRRADIQLKPTLAGGQSFRWQNTETDRWIGVFRNFVWILVQEEDHISYQRIGKAVEKARKGRKSLEETTEDDLLASYLRLNVDLSHYYKTWSEADLNFKKFVPRMFGIRILNQEVTENIFSFICSSNNNIKRISSMVEKLCEFYGEPIAEVDGQLYYGFPKVEALTQPTVESRLRNAGFGYRAKFIYQSACKINELGGSNWLNNLKKLPYKVAKNELMKLPGVGAKVDNPFLFCHVGKCEGDADIFLMLLEQVADCICLMSLGHMEAVPVDTHIFKVATDVYLPHLKKYKNINDRIYNQIGDYFRSLHGDYAGWANTILFCSDLKKLQSNEREECNKEK